MILKATEKTAFMKFIKEYCENNNIKYVFDKISTSQRSATIYTRPDVFFIDFEKVLNERVYKVSFCFYIHTEKKYKYINSFTSELVEKNKCLKTFVEYLNGSLSGLK